MYNASMHLHRGNLFLVGMPGCGKSTLGRLLARRLDKPFFDADVELERRLGVTIPVIFELEGEPGFRDREATILADLVVQNNIVLSTGGGVVLRPSNCERLKQGGTVLYLHAPPATLWSAPATASTGHCYRLRIRLHECRSSMRLAIRSIARARTSSSSRIASK